MSIGSEVGGPVTDQVASDLRRKIRDGTLRPGEWLGKATDLGKEYSAGTTTVRAALLRLVEEGLILGGRGRLYRVRQEYTRLEWDLKYESRSWHEEHGGGGDQWDTLVRSQGHAPSQAVEMSLRSTAQLPAEVTRLLRCDGKVVVRSRDRRVDGKPSMLAVSYFPYEIVKDTQLMEPEDVHVPGGILAASGHPQHHVDWDIGTRMPLEEEAAHFELPRGVPVYDGTCTGYEVNGEHPDGIPVRVMTVVAPGDRWRILAREDAS